MSIIKHNFCIGNRAFLTIFKHYKILYIIIIIQIYFSSKIRENLIPLTAVLFSLNALSSMFKIETNHGRKSSIIIVSADLILTFTLPVGSFYTPQNYVIHLNCISHYDVIKNLW